MLKPLKPKVNDIKFLDNFYFIGGAVSLFNEQSVILLGGSGQTNKNRIINPFNGIIAGQTLKIYFFLIRIQPFVILGLCPQVYDLTSSDLILMPQENYCYLWPLNIFIQILNTEKLMSVLCLTL